jgi:hypothetical protein
MIWNDKDSLFFGFATGYTTEPKNNIFFEEPPAIPVDPMTMPVVSQSSGNVIYLRS